MSLFVACCNNSYACNNSDLDKETNQLRFTYTDNHASGEKTAAEGHMRKRMRSSGSTWSWGSVRWRWGHVHDSLGEIGETVGRLHRERSWLGRHRRGDALPLDIWKHPALHPSQRREVVRKKLWCTRAAKQMARSGAACGVQSWRGQKRLGCVVNGNPVRYACTHSLRRCQSWSQSHMSMRRAVQQSESRVTRCDFAM